MSRKNTTDKSKNISNDNNKEKPDNSVRAAIIGAVALVVTTIISALLAPIMLERAKETPPATPQALVTNTPFMVGTISTSQETGTPTRFIYSNDFSGDNGGFPIGNATDTTRTMKQYVANGEYRWDNTNYGPFVWTLIPNDLPILSNFEITVDAKIEDDSIGEDSTVGLIIRNNSDKYYYFGIRPTSSEFIMALVQLQDGNWKWNFFDGSHKTISAIRQEGFNNLKLLANNERLSFYVNDKLIADIADDTIKSGNIGIMIYSHENIPTTFVIDNFQVRQLP